MLVWQQNESNSFGHVAIAGDFLPASGLQLPQGRNWKDIAAGFSRYFAKADVAILNLECCLDAGTSTARPKFGLGDSFSAMPEALEFPLGLGARVIGMANNHVYDYGEEGVARTRQLLLERRLAPLGVGQTLSEPPDVVVAETLSGARVGIWAAARHLHELATRKKPGVEPATRSRGEQALHALKAEGATTTIAFLHAGLEHTNRPDPDDVALMDDLAKMGFDVVTACHSHRICGHKRVCRPDGSLAFCFYGLGSISSGVIYSDLEREGLVVLIGLGKLGKIARVDVHPVYLEESGWGRIPLLGDADNTVKRFVLLSQEIEQGTYQQKFYSDIKSNLFRQQFRDVRAALQNGGMRGLATKLGRVRMRHLNRVLHSGIN